MNYLLDTHVFLWYIDGNKKLSSKVSSIISNLDNDIYLSKVSLWEIVIKSSNGKLDLQKSLRDIEDVIRLNNFILLDIDFSHLTTLNSLPYFHRDPFDRLIIAQAITDKFILITDDVQLKAYPVEILI